MAKKRGRPTEYKEEFIDEADKYLKACKDKYRMLNDSKESKGIGVKDGDQSKVFEVKEKRRSFIKVNLPTIEGFAFRIGVHKDTLYEWAKLYPDFSDSLSRIKDEQKQRLLNMGLSGEYNPTIAKLILSANHGMVERQDLTTDGKELPTPIYGGKSTD